MKKLWIIGAIVGGTYLSTVLVYVIHFSAHGVSADPADWGTFGDYLGGVVNPLLSFATFVGVLLSLYFTHQELQGGRDQPHMESAIQLLGFYTGRLDTVTGSIISLVGSTDGTIYATNLPHRSQVGVFTMNTVGWHAQVGTKLQIAIYKLLEQLNQLSPGHPHLVFYATHNCNIVKRFYEQGWTDPKVWALVERLADRDLAQ
ncbi:MAG: hypothetical protein K1X75_16950 [Leptospirales bacterium]|nr:hypothetical protein [Leptospirales bacterium]